MKLLLILAGLGGGIYLLISNVHNQAITKEYCRKKSESLVKVTYEASMKIRDVGSQRAIFEQCVEEEAEMTVLESIRRLMDKDYGQEGDF